MDGQRGVLGFGRDYGRRQVREGLPRLSSEDQEPKRPRFLVGVRSARIPCNTDGSAAHSASPLYTGSVYQLCKVSEALRLLNSWRNSPNRLGAQGAEVGPIMKSRNLQAQPVGGLRVCCGTNAPVLISVRQGSVVMLLGRCACEILNDQV